MSTEQQNTFQNQEAEWAVGQLRHLYRLLIVGEVKDQRAVALGLLGPVIERLEPLTTPQALYVTTTPNPNATGCVPVTVIVPSALAPDGCVQTYAIPAGTVRLTCIRCGGPVDGMGRTVA